MRRPIGITALAIYFWFHGVISLGSAFIAFRSHGMSHPGTFFWPDLVFGLGLGLIGWGLFRLWEWARFACMFVIVVVAGARLPLYLFKARHIDTSLSLIVAEEFLELFVVWYLFRSATAKHFSRMLKAA